MWSPRRQSLYCITKFEKEFKQIIINNNNNNSFVAFPSWQIFSLGLMYCYANKYWIQSYQTTEIISTTVMLHLFCSQKKNNVPVPFLGYHQSRVRTQYRLVRSSPPDTELLASARRQEQLQHQVYMSQGGAGHLPRHYNLRRPHQHQHLAFRVSIIKLKQFSNIKIPLIIHIRRN